MLSTSTSSAAVKALKLVAPLSATRFFLHRRWAAVDVPVPTMGESITEGTIQTWRKQPGEVVEADEVIAVIDTDKISVDVNSPVSGRLLAIDAGDGETVYVGNRLFVVETDPEAAPTPSSAEDDSGDDYESGARPTAASTTTDTQSTSVSVAPDAVPTSTESKPTTTPPPPADDGRTETVVPLSRMRQRIGERLKSAQSEGVLLTTFQECDMGNVMELRKRIGPAVMEKYNTKLGFMSFFIAACAKALKKYPGVNSILDGKNLITPNYCDISVAVATPSGLTVPVIKNAEKKSLVELEAELLGLAKAARDGKLGLEQMSGGTFTISNGGVYGSMMGCPIVNPPQSAILGMHSIVNRPVVRDGQVVIRPVMYLALTYDHRIVDGREAVSFLKAVSDYIEEPTKIFMDL